MTDKAIIFLADGMADEPIKELGNKTPLQYAKTPGMDSIAAYGNSGTLLTLPDGFPTSSDVANMSVLGCNLESEYCGRGPMEAVGRAIDTRTDDKIFRLNLTTEKNGILTDFSGGHIDQDGADRIIAALNMEFGTQEVSFHTGVSYRNLLVLSGPKHSHKIATEKPDDNQGELVDKHLPIATSPDAAKSAKFLQKLIHEAPAVIKRCNTTANGLWPCGGGSVKSFRSLNDKYGITGAVISGVDVINGLGRCLGMDVIAVPGATGYIDTNYEGKASAALDALSSHDLVYIHVEATDEVSHTQDLDLKIKAIEDFDAKIVSTVIDRMPPGTSVAVLPDHPVPIATGKHTRVPVPVSVSMRGLNPDDVQTFDEESCKLGSLGAMAKDDLMNILFGQPKGD